MAPEGNSVPLYPSFGDEAPQSLGEALGLFPMAGGMGNSWGIALVDPLLGASRTPRDEHTESAPALL